MTSGRTSPALLSCEDESASAAGEWVVKLRASIQQAGLLKELVGNRLASYFCLPTPEPALITIEPELARLIANSHSSKAALINGSVGLNFGTKVMTGFGTWLVDRPIPGAIRQTATEIFAFDALIQNPDRRFDNSNVLVNGETVLIFDHELAFSFLLDIFPSPTPWQLDRQKYLMNHVYYRQLKSQNVDLNAFTLRLAGLSDAVINQIFADVPSEWNNDDVPKIGLHLGVMRDHAEEFAEEIRRFLV